MKHGPLSKLLVSHSLRGQHGHSRTPKTMIICGPGNGLGTGYCEYYHTAIFEMTFETWLKVAKLSNRYRRFVEYVEEIKPQWKEVRREGFADNSEDSIQVSNDGRTRRVQVDGPHGDVCF